MERKLLLSLLALPVAALLTLPATASAAESMVVNDAVARLLAEHVCADCHGPDGRSTTEHMPSLAAQQRRYLYARIKGFGPVRGERLDPHDYMLGTATVIDNEIAAALAQYFSELPPPAKVAGDPELARKGAQLFKQSRQGVPACADCHGRDALGQVIIPRLAGQRADYLERQLEQIQKNLRESPVMHGLAKDLGPDEIKAIAVYLQGR